MTYQDLLLEREDGIATITLNKPDKLNAMSWTTWRELRESVAECDADDDVKVIIVTGAGRGFSSGTDLTAASQDEIPSRRETMRSGYLSAVSLIHSAKPTIAAVNGIAAGAGLSIALACDIRIGAASSRYSAIFVKRALSADFGCSYLLPRVVGMSNAMRLMYTGDIIDAQEALRIGLLSEVVPDEALIQRARELSLPIAHGPSIAIEATKRLVYRQIEAEIDAHVEYEEYLQRLTHQSEDALEGRMSFLEKREPRFHGR
ncbi:MAG TPA: enoyl-CoA hydratase-related protein [Dehalococcoidia bacterium]|nr:enoyl-CoA hydratase-related protein [Dehalococcoidia bacterium]